MSYFKCPNCSKALEKQNKTYTCQNRHAFDCAKSGYVNLLQVQNAKQHGDDLHMLKARKAFLDQGYYQKLVDCISEIIGDTRPQTILDSGCGEGWYADNLKGNHDIYGIDISKQGCDLSAKRNSSIKVAVGSTYQMPILDASMDYVYSIFAPFSITEVDRVLKETGHFIYVFPLENHLLDLKQALYEEAYLNEVEDTVFPGFKVIQELEVKDTITLPSNQDIQNLFMMTQYVHRTSRVEQKKLDALTSLTTRLAFGVKVYGKAL